MQRANGHRAHRTTYTAAQIANSHQGDTVYRFPFSTLAHFGQVPQNTHADLAFGNVSPHNVRTVPSGWTVPLCVSFDIATYLSFSRPPLK